MDRNDRCLYRTYFPYVFAPISFSSRLPAVEVSIQEAYIAETTEKPSENEINDMLSRSDSRKFRPKD